MAPTQPDRPSPFRCLLPAPWPARLALLAAAWVLGMTTVSLVSASGSDDSTANRPIKAKVAEDIVSSDTCRSCHPGNYASWHASFHRTMTQVASPATVATDMDGLKFTHHGIDYRVDRQDDKYIVRTKLANTPESAFGHPQQIVLLTGSHIIQVCWLATGDGRTLGQFPFSYLIAEKRWVPVKETFLTPPGPEEIYGKGDWNNTCMNCHVTQPLARPAGSSGTFDSQVGEFGISCEACHSGGQEHIAQNRNPLRRFALHFKGEGDPTIVNPAKLDGPRSSLVCGQCHSIWAFTNLADMTAFTTKGGQYRAGQAELDLRWIAQPHGTDHPEQRAQLAKADPHFFEDIFWPDGQIRVIGREYNGVSASPCFKGGNYSCLSCHELHPTNTDPASLDTWRRTGQLKPAMDTNQACLQCHTALKANLTAHTHHAAESPGSTCYNCHMPHSIYGLLKATRSHTISSPSVRESTEQARPNACNLCHLDKSLGWTANQLSAWYGQKPPALSDDDRHLAAGARWLLQGDARQRALVGLNMGLPDAQRAAGRDWMYPYLIFQLNDPYSAVRFGAWKSLQSLPGFADYAFDYTIDDAAQKEAQALAYRKWWFEVRKTDSSYRFETVLEPTGMFQQATFDRLLDTRDKKKITIVE